MASPQPSPKFDSSAFLAWEEKQPDKHEFFRGEVFAMVGARRVHAAVTRNLLTAFWSFLRGGPCEAYGSDLRVRVEAADVVFYPDLLVTCHPGDRSADLAVEHPVLVVEVLSDSTAAFDRGEKFAAYRQLDSLKEYALIDIAARRVECFRRDATGHWVLYEFSGQEQAEFASVDLAVPLAEIFENVEPPALPGDAPATPA